MDEAVPKTGKKTGLNTPGWILFGIVLSGGLFLFVWLAIVGRRVFSRDARVLFGLLPIGAMLWVSGVSLMLRGALAPTIPGETGNPLFLAGFLLVALCIPLMFVFNTNLTRQFTASGPTAPIHARVVGFTAAAVCFLFGQLVVELTPVAPQNGEIIALFQLICLMAAAVLGIQWVERVHARYIELPSQVSAATVHQAAPSEQTARL